MLLRLRPPNRVPVMLLALSAVIAFGGACSRCGRDTAADAAPPVAALPSATSEDAKAPATPLDDLLHFTDARVGVSSKVDNPRDFAEHLVDGRFDTAWNGRTGDLVGAWIGFRLPREVHVRAIELTAGYVARSKKGEDLFAANHRITRVRLLHDGKPLGVTDLDPERRTFQRIPVDAPGGDFRIEVLAVKVGARATWRELAISELRVLGDAGAAKRGVAAVPRVVVGSLEAPPASTFDGGRHGVTAAAESAPTPEALCASYLAPLVEEYDEMSDSGGFDTFEHQPPSCTSNELTQAHGVRVLTLHRGNLSDTWTELAVAYGGRVHVLGLELEHDSYNNPHCGGYGGGRADDVHIEASQPPVLTARLYAYQVHHPWPSSGPDERDGLAGGIHVQIQRVTCTLAAAGPSCTTTPAIERELPYDPTFSPDEPPPFGP